MLLCNTTKHSKIIGVGKLSILPGKAEELPPGYDGNHPVVKYLVGRGYAEIVAEIPTTQADALSVTPPDTPPGEDIEQAGKGQTTTEQPYDQTKTKSAAKTQKEG